MTCFRAAHGTALSSRAKGGSAGGMEKAPWTSGEDAMRAVCGFMGCDVGGWRALGLEAA